MGMIYIQMLGYYRENLAKLQEVGQIYHGSIRLLQDFLEMGRCLGTGIGHQQAR